MNTVSLIDTVKTTRKVQAIIKPPKSHMVGDGFKVHNFFPSGLQIGQKRMSPFFLMDYNAKMEIPPSDQPRGVGVHPHRGFETVTIAYQGKVAHHDSSGNSGIIEQGDVQWMTAASGILHKEYYEKEYNTQGGFFQMVQLWVNLPAKDKMSKPKYQPLLHSQMGKYQLDNNSGTVNVIAGEYNGVKGPAYTFTPINLFDVKLNGKGLIKLDLPEKYNTGILIIEGKVKVNGVEEVPVDNFVLFKNEGTEITIEALEDSQILVLSGEPIDEPIVAYGPFLMNRWEDIDKAVTDFNDGKFGFLED